MNPQDHAITEAHTKIIESVRSGDHEAANKITNELNGRFLDREFWYETDAYEVRLHSRPKRGSFYGNGFMP